MLTIIGNHGSDDLTENFYVWAIFSQIHGAFLICMEMSGNGRQTGIYNYPSGNPVVDPVGPARGRAKGSEEVLGTMSLRSSLSEI